MMTFTDFMAKYNGRFVDFDGVYGAQCMDLMHQYCVDVLGLQDGRILAAPGAKDVYLNFENLVGKNYFEKIANTPTGVPKEGDIVLWGTKIGQFGHVAVFIEGDANRFSSFDENFPTGSPCHVQQHSYNGVLGWLRFKKESASEWCLPKDVAENLVRKSTIIDKVRDKLQVEDSETVILAEVDKLIKYEDAVVEKDKQLGDANSKINKLTEDLQKLKDEHDEALDDNKKLTDEAKKQAETIDIQGEKITELSEQIEKLKEQTNIPLLSGWKKALYDFLVKLGR